MKEIYWYFKNYGIPYFSVRKDLAHDVGMREGRERHPFHRSCVVAAAEAGRFYKPPQRRSDTARR